MHIQICMSTAQDIWWRKPMKMGTPEDHNHVLKRIKWYGKHYWTQMLGHIDFMRWNCNQCRTKMPHNQKNETCTAGSSYKTKHGCLFNWSQMHEFILKTWSFGQRCGHGWDWSEHDCTRTHLLLKSIWWPRYRRALSGSRDRSVSKCDLLGVCDNVLAMGRYYVYNSLFVSKISMWLRILQTFVSNCIAFGQTGVWSDMM